MSNYVIAEGIASLIQCLVVWLVVTIANRKSGGEWAEAFERWTDRKAAESVEELTKILAARWEGPDRTTAHRITNDWNVPSFQRRCSANPPPFRSAASAPSRAARVGKLQVRIGSSLQVASGPRK
jgi:hypothetical protein